MSETQTRETINIGVECFGAADGSVLCWRGVNYVPQGAAVVHDAAPGEDCLGSPGCRGCLARDLADARAELSRLRAVVEAVQAALEDRITGSLGTADWAIVDGRQYASVNPDWLRAIVAEARSVRAALAPVSSSGEAESGAHPEDFCDRCGGRNVKPWFAPSDVWNAVVGDEWSIICPQCFVELAEGSERFADEAWELRPTIRYPAPVSSGGQA
jgi:hypothetical protein